MGHIIGTIVLSCVGVTAFCSFVREMSPARQHLRAAHHAADAERLHSRAH